VFRFDYARKHPNLSRSHPKAAECGVRSSRFRRSQECLLGSTTVSGPSSPPSVGTLSPLLREGCEAWKDEGDAFMRIYEGDYAYEIEQVLDPSTQVPLGWRYNIYRGRPGDELLRTGQAPTREAAQEAGKRALAEVVRKGQRAGSTRNQPAA
jgi:hypothetical protein